MAYVVERQGDLWAFVARLTSPNPSVGDGFGESIGIEGNTIVVGAPNDWVGDKRAGAAYVFTNDGMQWVASARIVATDFRHGAGFGSSVAIHENLIVIGAPNHRESDTTWGVAYVFRREGSTWLEEVRLSEAGVQSRFGTAVALFEGAIAVGAPGSSWDDPAPGTVYLYRRETAEWERETGLHAGDTTLGDEFGSAISMVDGDVIVGAPGHHHPHTPGIGSAYYFQRESDGWVQVAQLSSPVPENSSQFGRNVAVAGHRCAVGGKRRDYLGGDATVTIFNVLSEPDCNTNGVNDACELDCNLSGLPDECDIANGTSQDVDGNMIPDECQVTRLYVAAGATGANIGTSWTDAYIDLQEALANAARPGGNIEEIWVTQGIYRPAPPAGDRATSFRLVSGVAMYGGFAGWEDRLDQRDPTANETILSGDLMGDDGLAGENNGENCFHVVTAACAAGSARMDGFAVTAGNANSSSSWPHSYGGGMYLESGDAKVVNCVFRKNFAFSGGGFVSMWPTSIEGCLFEYNSALQGGGLFVGAVIDISGCRFVSNDAINGGGVFAPEYHDLTLKNCALIANGAETGGGAHFEIWLCEPSVVNCTFIANHATVGAGIYRGGYGTYHVMSLTNSILWDNFDAYGKSETAQIYFEDTRVVRLAYSCIQGWSGFFESTSCFGLDPRFVDADGHDHEYGTSDDNLHLRADSPFVDAGDNEAPLLPILDLDGLPRIQQCRVDLGPYESPYFRDCNANAASDACDIAAGVSADLNVDGIPDECESPTPTIIERQVLRAHDNQPGQFFGTTVAISENTAAVGAPAHVADGIESGGVYTFRRNGQGWQQSTLLVPSDGAADDRFGASIALSANTLVVGAPDADGVGASSGAVYIFRRSPSDWIQYTKLQPIDAGPWDRFGTSVAIHKNTIVIGAPLRQCAYVYRFDGLEWIQNAVLRGYETSIAPGFGTSVAIDSSWVVVGSPMESDFGSASGATHVFRRGDADFIHEARLIPPVGRSSDRFGTSLALSGNDLLIGTWRGNYVAVYHYDGVRWFPQARLQASDESASNHFGYAVAFAGQDILVGAQIGWSSGGYVTAYLFRFSGDHWQETMKFVPSESSPSGLGGYSLAGTKRTILVGVVGYGPDESAYIFDPADGVGARMDTHQYVDPD
ncbi:MAG TPA: choice-of-anchor Q domain-containing protein [Phycisphaerae bacterium]|nr:choice-of-anchor Q domain-containing protein [Phycisphaerae bacterium]